MAFYQNTLSLIIIKASFISNIFTTFDRTFSFVISCDSSFRFSFFPFNFSHILFCHCFCKFFLPSSHSFFFSNILLYHFLNNFSLLFFFLFSLTLFSLSFPIRCTSVIASFYFSYLFSFIVFLYFIPFFSHTSSALSWFLFSSFPTLFRLFCFSILQFLPLHFNCCHFHIFFFLAYSFNPPLKHFLDDSKIR